MHDCPTCNGKGGKGEWYYCNDCSGHGKVTNEIFHLLMLKENYFEENRIMTTSPFQHSSYAQEWSITINSSATCSNSISYIKYNA